MPSIKLNGIEMLDISGGHFNFNDVLYSPNFLRIHRIEMICLLSIQNVANICFIIDKAACIFDVRGNSLFETMIPCLEGIQIF